METALLPGKHVLYCYCFRAPGHHAPDKAVPGRNRLLRLVSELPCTPQVNIDRR